MRAEQVQNFVLIALLLVLGTGMGIAYWFGGDRGPVGASTPAAPVKKFRADPGTERENARALVSSLPSVKEETTDRPIEIWGSLDEDDAPESVAYRAASDSIEGLTPEEALESLSAQLDSGDVRGEERAHLEATLGLALLSVEPRDTEAARDAFARAFKACADGDARVGLAVVYADVLFARDEHEELVELLKDGRFVGATFTPARLRLEALRGLALDALGRPDQARAAYERAFASALKSDVKESARGRDAARVIAMRLARHYREDGRREDAIAVSRKMRAWLAEEDLVLR